MLTLSIGNMSHIVPHKLTTHPTFGLFASVHPNNTKKTTWLTLFSFM